jgi:hypothetical protein
VRAPFLVTPLALLASGCELISGGTACTAQAVPGIMVDVRDSVTSAPAGRGSRIIARDGAVADTAKFTEFDGPYGVAYERAGTYTVSVEQQGYRLWSRTGIRVTTDECHVRTVSVAARLQR